jgi:hypothetical protein
MLCSVLSGRSTTLFQRPTTKSLSTTKWNEKPYGTNGCFVQDEHNQSRTSSLIDRQKPSFSKICNRPPHPLSSNTLAHRTPTQIHCKEPFLCQIPPRHLEQGQALLPSSARVRLDMPAPLLTWTWDDRYYKRFKVIAWIGTFGGRASQHVCSPTPHLSSPSRPFAQEKRSIKAVSFISSPPERRLK